jgi:hypothetical protein
VLDLHTQLDYAHRIVKFSGTVLWGTHHAVAGEFTRKDYVPLALIRKACMTFDAITSLVERGNGDDSFSLLRTLVESTVNAAYLWHKDDATADLFVNFSEFRKWIEFRDLKAIAPMFISDVSENEEHAMEKRYLGLRAKFKNDNEWCTESLFQRALFVDQTITSGLKKQLTPEQFAEDIGSEYQIFRILVRLPWRKGSAFVHGTAAALRGQLSVNDDGDIKIGVDRLPTELAWVVYLSNFVTLQLLAVANEILGAKHSAEWQELYREVLERRIATS